MPLAGLGLPPEREFARLKESLAARGFDEQHVAARLGGQVETPTRRARNLPRLRWATREPDSLNCLIRLFLLGLPVPFQPASEALAPASAAPWLEAGVLVLEGGDIRSPFKLVPQAGLLMLSDDPALVETGAPPDIVLGMTTASLDLVNFTVRRPVDNALDLGCGCGVQALLAARHSAQVTATDTNARAVRITAFNARLNGLANIECIVADGLEPLRGRRFDLIVTNPPFTILPGRRYTYRDSGAGGDAFCRALAADAPAFLNEGGLLQMCADWIHPAGGDPEERLAGWFAGSGCDVRVLRTGWCPAGRYIQSYLQQTEEHSPPRWSEFYAEAEAFCRSEGIESVSTGLIAMRKRAGPNWFRIEDHPRPGSALLGEGIGLEFRLSDWLEGIDGDRALLGLPLRLAPGVTLESRSAPAGGGAWPLRLELKREAGLRCLGEVEPGLARLIARCEGSAPLGRIIEETAAAASIDAERLAGACLPAIRHFVERGLLLPPGFETWGLPS